MKHVGVREFRDHATRYLAGDEPLAIERNGTPIGYYWPLAGKSNGAGIVHARKASTEATQAGEALQRTLQEIYKRTGLTEEELARYFDLSVPVEDL
jgi:hypothetical protein